VTFKVTDVQETPEGKKVTIEVRSAEADASRPGTFKPANLTDTMVWLVGSKGITMLTQSYRPAAGADLKPTSFNPPMLSVPFPIKDGQTTEYTGTGARMGGMPGPFKVTHRTVGLQEVDTDAGRMSALCTESEFNFETEQKIKYVTNVSTWWAPKVGIVRYVVAITLTQPNGQRANILSTLRMKSSSK
jgi:hypothetical protein